MTFDQNQTTGIFKISGHLRIDEIDLLKNALCEYVLNQQKLALDLSAIESCDTSGLQLLLAAEKTAAYLQKPFSLKAISDAVTTSAATLGLTLVAEGVRSK